MPSLYAQKSTTNPVHTNKWFVGVNGGVNMYWGDIKFNAFWPALKMKELQPGLGLAFGRSFSSTLKISSELNFSSLRGMQEIFPDTLEFNTQALSFALKGHFNIIHFLNKKDSKFAFFIESGAGIMVWKTLLQSIYTNDTINNLGWTNSNKEFGLFIPLGIQFEYQLSPRISTHFTSNYTLVLSDMLDGKALGGNDSYSYNSLGINYYFGKQKTIPKLLPYTSFEITYDSLTFQTKKKKSPPKEKKKIKEIINPFSINFEVPKQAPHSGFDVNINIKKFGIPASGFFRLLVPSGFIPQTTPNTEVSFTKLGYRYEYEFILPMNQDSTFIPIHIKLSEIEKGTFPVLVEGEIMDQKGNIFPIKFANYIEIISEDLWNQGLLNKEQEKQNLKLAAEKLSETAQSESAPLLVQKEKTKSEENKAQKAKVQKTSQAVKGIYRIQIMATRKPFTDLKNFKTKHKITGEIFIAQADGWYRFNLYTSENRNEAEQLKEKVRTIHGLTEAFIVYYENGKRILNKAEPRKSKTSTISKNVHYTKQVIPKQTESGQFARNETTLNNKLLYRIEIALGYDQPIPLYLLQNKVGKEPISEFKNKLNYYYTIGVFEDFEIAKAFLDYVKTQLKLGNAKIAQYQNNKRIKVVL